MLKSDALPATMLFEMIDACTYASASTTCNPALPGPVVAELNAIVVATTSMGIVE